MYFKKLEVFGFKSFADKTALNFEPGVTAIIGPNGCGKSNVFDAIRWVLGEQSMKQLRGSSSGDVIFNGTDRRPPLGFAEVSVTFSDVSDVLNLDYDEVTVTRRLFRSGESEYLINKSPVRLKDISEMFMGTGVGAEAYSLVQQGKVDLVVSSKPDDRRMIFDEAAGITKYKSKKREAVNKLKATEDNLLRLNDIVIEVKRQISSLERQAKKAARYKEEYEKLKVLETTLALYQIATIEEQREQIQTLLNDLEDKEGKMGQELEELNHLVVRESEQLEQLELQLQELRSDDLKIENEIEINHRQIGFNEERIEGLANNEARLTEQKQQLEEKCREQEQKIKEVETSIADLDKFLEEGTKNLDEKKAVLDDIVKSIGDAEETIKADEEKILALTSKQVNIKNRLTDIMKDIQGCLARKRRLDLEHSKVTSEKTQVEQKLTALQHQIDETKQQIGHLQETLKSQQLTLEEKNNELITIEKELAGLEKKKHFLISQKEFIEKMQVQYQDNPDPTTDASIFTSAQPKGKHNGVIAKVKEVRPVSGLRLASLKHLAKMQGQQLYEIICETKFLELDPEAMDEKIIEIEASIQEKTQQKTDKAEEIASQKELIEQSIKSIHEAEKEWHVFEAQVVDLKREETKLNEELESVAIETKEAEEAMAAAKSREEENAKELNETNQEMEWSQTNIREGQERIATKVQDREDASVTIAQLETELGSINDKENSLKDNLEVFARVLESDQNDIKRIEEESQQQEGQKGEFSGEIEKINETIQELKVKREGVQEKVNEVDQQKNDVDARLNSVRANISAIEGDIIRTKEERHNQALKTQSVEFSEQGIKDRLLQSYKINLDELPEAPVPTEQEGEEQVDQGEEPEVNIEEVQVEIERLKKRCDSFGAVNLVAIDEFEELKERFEFLTKQQSDLIEAKEALHKTINKINRTTRQLFMETFTKVNEEFRVYFRLLFGGGEAELILLEPDNVLESGIEIVARPPGKKLQNISLMSGGEKTMTAIALIFAVFKVNPSPFCVLDEIDAALDESNVGRYADLLKEFAKVAQFIVITHNKRTIENADILYGITMQERGVSNVVSVRLTDQNKDAEPDELVMAEA